MADGPARACPSARWQGARLAGWFSQTGGSRRPGAVLIARDGAAARDRRDECSPMGLIMRMVEPRSDFQSGPACVVQQGVSPAGWLLALRCHTFDYCTLGRHRRLLRLRLLL